MEDGISKRLAKYRRMGALSARKLREYIPAMIMTNLSSLLLLTVDGVVAGNLIGQDALASINIFYPASILAGAATMLVSAGVSISLSTAMGKNDQAELDRVKGISLRVMLISAAVISVIQIPVIWLIIMSYGLPDDIFAMTMQYAVGIMLCTPLGVVSSVGTYQLQIAGKMNVLMKLSVIEGVGNLLFDLFFMGVLDTGVAGAGFGTACANALRCGLTVFYIARYTDMYRSNTKKVSAADVMGVLSPGVPDFSYVVVRAVQNYLIMKILLAAFGTSGAAIKGVCSLCFNISYVLIGGISGSMRPLMGLYAGGEDKEGLRILMRQGAVLNIIAAGTMTLVTGLRPELLFAINGIRDIPEGGALSLRLYALYIVFNGFDSLFRIYLTNRKDTRFTTMLTLVGSGSMPLFAFILWKTAPAPYIFLAYLASELVVFSMSCVRYRDWLEKDRKEIEENGHDIVLYMTVHPEEAVEASRELRSFAEDHGISRRIAYRVALCMEEMVAYARAAEAIDPVMKLIEESEADKKLAAVVSMGGTAPWTEKVMKDTADRLSVEVIVRFRGEHEAIFIELDDGRCIALETSEVSGKLITDNYELLRKLAESVEYQYILNMNYTRFTFREN